MRNIIIGTAGHVDHGKTALIRALTGINTDRLKEEQKRGITIDLGFAYLLLPDGNVAGVVDVPGHEKFIKNMLAGAGGMDLVLLVVAADDGVMPQTREHLDILNMLEAETGIIVMTKTDLVDAEWIEAVQEEIRSAAAGTFLADAPIMPVSSYTGEGIEALRAKIYEAVEHAGNRNQDLPFRLPVDRVFSVDGFGSVATGTLIEGRLQKGDEIMVYPSGRSARIRNLQVHSHDVDTAYAGQRVAVNLAGLTREEVARGNTLAMPGSMSNSMILDVKLKILPSCMREVKHGLRLHFYYGTCNVLCRLVLLDADNLIPGEEGYAQLRFFEDVTLKKGDRFVVRFYSPLETIGGGVVLDPVAVRHKRRDITVLEALKIREHGSEAEHIEQAIADASPDFAPLDEIRKQLDKEEAAFRRHLETLVAEKRIILLGEHNAVSAFYKRETGEKLEKILSAYHKENPLRKGMRREELRSRLWPGKKASLCDRLLQIYETEGIIHCSENKAALTGFAVTFNEIDKKIRGEILRLFSEAGFSPPAMAQVYSSCSGKDKKAVDRVIEAVVEEGVLVAAAPGIFFSADSIAAAREIFRALAERKRDGVTLGEFRDETGTSRKFALALLEYFDKIGLTRKVGDARAPVNI